MVRTIVKPCKTLDNFKVEESRGTQGAKLVATMRRNEQGIDERPSAISLRDRGLRWDMRPQLEGGPGFGPDSNCVFWMWMIVKLMNLRCSDT